MTGLLDAACEVKDTGQFGFLDRCVTTLELNRFSVYKNDYPRGDIHHFSFANSFVADFRKGMSESASFHSAKKS